MTAEEYQVKLSVRQAWKGVQPGPLEVMTANSGASCGFDFQVGKRYLVGAWKRPLDGRWTVSTCSLTQEYNGSGDAAEFLASLSGPPRGGRVFGSVKVNERGFEFDRHPPDRPCRPGCA